MSIAYGGQTSPIMWDAGAKRPFIFDNDAITLDSRVLVASDVGLPQDGSDCYPILRGILDKIKSGELLCDKFVFNYCASGYFTSSQIRIDFPLHLHFSANLTGTYTNKQCLILFEGAYSSTDPSALLKGCKVTGDGWNTLDGNGANISGYSYSTSDTYYSTVLFKWCDAPVLKDINVTNGLVNCARSFQCRNALFYNVTAYSAVFDNGLSHDFDPPFYSASNPSTWGSHKTLYCKAYNFPKGCGITMYGAVMRGLIAHCVAWNCGKRGGEAAVGDVIGTAFSIEDDANNQHAKQPRIRVIDCYAKDSANGFFVSCDYVDIDNQCRAENNTYPFGSTDSANAHGNGYSLINVRNVRCYGNSKGNSKYGVRGLGYKTLFLDNIEIGGQHFSNSVTAIELQGCGRVDIIEPYVYGQGAENSALIDIVNITDYNVGAGYVLIRGGNCSNGGSSALKILGVADARVISLNTKDVCKATTNTTPAIFISGTTKSSIRDCISFGAYQKYVVLIDNTSSSASIFNCSGDYLTALYLNQSTTPFDVNGDIQSAGDNNVTAWSGSFVDVFYQVAITANRTVTLPTLATKGDRVRVTRTSTSTGAFNVSLGALKSLSAASTWAEARFDGSSWVLTSTGTI